MTRTVQVAMAKKVLVPESSLEAAQHAIESLTEPDELVDEQP